MRTTLDIDDDVLQACRERASVEARSVGFVLSDLARKGLRRRLIGGVEERNGFPILRGTSGIVTSELVADLLDEA